MCYYALDLYKLRQKKRRRGNGSGTTKTHIFLEGRSYIISPKKGTTIGSTLFTLLSWKTSTLTFSFRSELGRTFTVLVSGQ